MALPARHRLTRPGDIGVTIRSGSRGRSGPFVVHSRVNAGDAPAATRFAFALPRSVGAAVARNRVRRRIQGLVHDWDGSGALAPDVDVVIRVLPGAADLGTADIRRRLEPVLHRLGVLRPGSPPAGGGPAVGGTRP